MMNNYIYPLLALLFAIATTEAFTPSPRQTQNIEMAHFIKKKISDQKQTNHTHVVATKPSSPTKRAPSRLYTNVPRYQSDEHGGLFDITEGPHHHLIDVDKVSLEEQRVLKEKNSVQVHEMQLDSINVMAVSFGIMIFVLFVLASDTSMAGQLATLKNFVSE